MPGGADQTTKTNVVVGGVAYEITNMVGHTVAYPREFLVSQGFVLPKDWPVKIFSLKPNETIPAAIVERADALQGGTEHGKVTFYQGWEIIVTDDYVLGTDDLTVFFPDAYKPTPPTFFSDS